MSGSFYNLNYVLNDNQNLTNNVASMKIRAYPNNFIYSGYWYGSSAYVRGSYGRSWSSSAYGSNRAYNLNLYSSNDPGTDISNKYGGYSVRCVAGS